MCSLSAEGPTSCQTRQSCGLSCLARERNLGEGVGEKNLGRFFLSFFAHPTVGGCFWGVYGYFLSKNFQDFKLSWPHPVFRSPDFEKSLDKDYDGFVRNSVKCFRIWALNSN